MTPHPLLQVRRVNLLLLINISIGLLTLSQGMLLYLFLCFVPVQGSQSETALDAAAAAPRAQVSEATAAPPDPPEPAAQEASPGEDIAWLPVGAPAAPPDPAYQPPQIDSHPGNHTERAPPQSIV